MRSETTRVSVSEVPVNPRTGAPPERFKKPAAETGEKSGGVESFVSVCRGDLPTR